jgi:hypothetical protein
VAAIAIDEGKARKRLLILSIGVTLLLYLIPFGRWIAYPLVLLSTLAHELGHGVTGALVGGTFDRFVMHWDASGTAYWSGSPSVTSGDVALVGAGGLVGPAVVAAMLFVLARWERAAKPALGVIAGGLVVALLLVVRNAFGVAFVSVLAASSGVLAWKASRRAARMALVFGAVQLALSVFSRGDYLFTDTARGPYVNGPSDVAIMSKYAGMPYWFWGLVCGAFSIAVLVFGTWIFLRSPKTAIPKTPR